MTKRLRIRRPRAGFLFVCLVLFFWGGGGGGFPCIYIKSHVVLYLIWLIHHFKMCILRNSVNNLWVIHESLRSRKAAWDRIHYMEGKSFIQRVWKAENIIPSSSIYRTEQIRPSSDGTYYGMVMSVRPGLRPSVRPSVTVFRTFLLHALTYWSEILCITLFLCT